VSRQGYFPPIIGKSEYHCPSCQVYASQLYSTLYAMGISHSSGVFHGKQAFNETLKSNWIVTKCQHCREIAIWDGDKLVFPKSTIAPPPNIDLTEEIKTDYLEAALVLTDSPRAAAALLRLALQKLCKQLGENGENINTDIKNLVKKGLNPLVQKSLDALRITGNNAVHPGEISLIEAPERVLQLFNLINFIADKLLTEPKQIESFYDELPTGAVEAVKKRDQNP
jgi:Domain of unknown function (DUF4145)